MSMARLFSQYLGSNPDHCVDVEFPDGRESMDIKIREIDRRNVIIVCNCGFQIIVSRESLVGFYVHIDLHKAAQLHRDWYELNGITK